MNRPINNKAQDPRNTTTDLLLTPLEDENFACAKDSLEDALLTNNQSPRALIKALGMLDLMRFRK